MRCKLRVDKLEEFINNYSYEKYKYGRPDNRYYFQISEHLILDEDTLEIIAPLKLKQEDKDLLAKLEANNMLVYLGDKDE